MHQRMFIISLVGLAVSAAVLILLVPSLFDSPDDVRVGLVGALAVVAVACAVGTRRWRPPTSVGGGR